MVKILQRSHSKPVSWSDNTYTEQNHKWQNTKAWLFNYWCSETFHENNISLILERQQSDENFHPRKDKPGIETNYRRYFQIKMIPFHIHPCLLAVYEIWKCTKHVVRLHYLFRLCHYQPSGPHHYRRKQNESLCFHTFLWIWRKYISTGGKNWTIWLTCVQQF